MIVTTTLTLVTTELMELPMVMDTSTPTSTTNKATDTLNLPMLTTHSTLLLMLVMLDLVTMLLDTTWE